MFDFVRVSTNILDEARLDSSYYSNRFLENEEKLANCSIAREEVFKLTSLCNCGSTPKKVEYSTDGVGLIRTSDVRPNRFILDKIARSNDCDIKDSTTAKVGDMLYTMSGTIGYACVIPEMTEEFSFSNTIARIRLPEGSIHDIHYISTFFNSHYGYEQSLRLTSGAIQGHVMPNPFKRLKVSLPASEAQKYIGEKVRQAERLRAWAKGLLNSSDAIISSQFEYSLAPSMRTQPRRVSSALLSPISLGPEFARASEGQATFSDSMKFGDFIDICKCGDPIKSEDRVDGKYSYYGASGPIDKHNEYNFDGEYLIVAQDGSIGCANIARGKFWANNHVWVVKLKAAYDIDSVCRYLDEHFPYWKGITTGSVVPKVTAENLLNLQIPTAIAENEHVGDLLRLSSRATSLSSILVNTAKLLVEDLIEGQLTESQLASAQQALEAGDDSLDRALLERMTAEGVDGEGEPLFDDIDQLYELLDKAKQALDSDDTMAEA
ncbi:restriction endonuclease subunit S [Vibrio parahaemolyticus]|uniref:restriction endonuclease subunit S n=1 Tax=Vibrio parahaemolyticus TaxID=670 RepID=UPI0022EB5E45|nr:restriction endonuclease subunit S [Vibrio parahaemolyticus]